GREENLPIPNPSTPAKRVGRIRRECKCVLEFQLAPCLHRGARDLGAARPITPMLCPHSRNRERVALPAASTHVHVPHAPIRFRLARAALQLDLPDRARAYLDGKMLVHSEPGTWARKRANGDAVDPMGCREDAYA